MSLLGRLEDLSLTDIVQIVYLSRRTGVLEIINSEGRHTVTMSGTYERFTFTEPR